MGNNNINIEMNLSDLERESGGMVKLLSEEHDAVFSSVEYDSRKVKPGSLFVAVEGFQTDGHEFIESAVENGAVSVVVSGKRIADFAYLKDKGFPVLVSDDSRRALSILSAIYYGRPSRDLMVFGITGTNGKTTITYMIEAVLKSCGFLTGVIGTVNYRWPGKVIPAPNTTPESKDIQELLFKMKGDGIEFVIMEVSSHALELNRVDDVDFNIAVFTNLTREHLDFHKDFENYFIAKKRIFKLLGKSQKEKKAGIVNIDDEFGERILQEREQYAYPLVSFGLDDEAFFKPQVNSINNKITGLSYILDSPLKDLEIDLHVSGKFQVYNSLAAIAALYMIDISYNSIQHGLMTLETVPGRFDVVKSDLGFNVIVDYAHTGDALLKVLQSVNELNPKRVITVFGCGGDRDRSKRPIMGSVALNNSDIIIITSDNPRTEDPDMIIQDIVMNLKSSNLVIIPDREEAIKKAIFSGENGDIVVIVGKGHEDYQIIGNNKIHFNDHEIAAKYIRKRKAG